MAHPSFPWRAEHVNRLVGLEPTYFSKQLVQHANTLPKDRILLASDCPLIMPMPMPMPDKWLKDFEGAGFQPEVVPGILKGNAVRLLRRDLAVVA